MVSSYRHGDGLLAGENMVSQGSQGGATEGGEEVTSEEGGYIGEFSRDYINAEIFKLFDVDGSGKITKSDLDEVAKQMGWSQRQSKFRPFPTDSIY